MISPFAYLFIVAIYDSHCGHHYHCHHDHDHHDNHDHDHDHDHRHRHRHRRLHSRHQTIARPLFNTTNKNIR